MADNENDSRNQGIIDPRIKEFTNNLALLLAKDDEDFTKLPPEQKLSKVIIAADDLLEPAGNWGLINLDMTIAQAWQIPLRK